MSEKKIEVCIGTDRSKNIRARLSLLVVDGDKIMSEQYHSIAIEPGADLARVRSANEANLADPNGGIPGAPWPAIPDEEWADVEAHVGIIHKPHIVEAHLEKKRIQQEARDEQQRLAVEEQERLEDEQAVAAMQAFERDKAARKVEIAAAVDEALKLHGKK